MVVLAAVVDTVTVLPAVVAVVLATTVASRESLG